VPVPPSPRPGLYFTPTPNRRSTTSALFTTTDTPEPQLEVDATPKSWASVRPQKAIERRLRSVVESEFFDYAIAVIISLNCVLMGAQAHIAAQAARDPDQYGEPFWIRITSSVFCILFTGELLMRIVVYRINFFVVDGWRWNVFDVVVVGLQLVEEVMAFQAAGSWEQLVSQRRERTASLSFLRILRILRLVRIIRVVRVLRLVRELRTMVHSIASTLVSLAWTVLLLLLLIYVTGICFTQMVADSGQDDPTTVAEGTPAYEYYGSLDRSIVALYQALTGGVNWRELMTPLVERTNPVMGFIFCLYIAFAVLAMLNVITGVFVGSALSKAKEEDNIDLVHSLREAVESMKVENTHMLSWEKVESQLQSPSMQFVFQSIDLDPSEASSLFRLLDPDNTGHIDAEDFVMGCLRVHGTAKSIDLTTLMCEVRWMRRRWVEHAIKVEEFIYCSGLGGWDEDIPSPLSDSHPQDGQMPLPVTRESNGPQMAPLPQVLETTIEDPVTLRSDQ